jgi:hypothetical protein
MNILIIFLTLLGVAIGAWGYKTREDRLGNMPWSDISQAQLELHHKLVIAMADRAHLDPACRELLRHQVKLLKSVGVVGKEVVDVSPSVLLEPPKPQSDGFTKISENKWVRNEEKAEGFGFYDRDTGSE